MKMEAVHSALAIMTAWAKESDEQVFLRSHISGLLADLDPKGREEALVDMCTGLIILAGGLLRAHTASTSTNVEDILRALQTRLPTDKGLDPPTFLR